MQLDRNAVDKLLSLSDESLKGVIKKISKEAGLDLKNFGISENDISAIRTALSGATDEDLTKAADQLNIYKASKEKKNE